MLGTHSEPDGMPPVLLALTVASGSGTAGPAVGHREGGLEPSVCLTLAHTNQRAKKSHSSLFYNAVHFFTPLGLRKTQLSAFKKKKISSDPFKQRRLECRKSFSQGCGRVTGGERFAHNQKGLEASYQDGIMWSRMRRGEYREIREQTPWLRLSQVGPDVQRRWKKEEKTVQSTPQGCSQTVVGNAPPHC